MVTKTFKLQFHVILVNWIFLIYVWCNGSAYWYDKLILVHAIVYWFIVLILQVKYVYNVSAAAGGPTLAESVYDISINWFQTLFLHEN